MKKFVKNVVKKKYALPFRVPKNISLVMVDADTGLQPDNNTKKIIYESFKTEDNFIVSLEKPSNKDKLSTNDIEKEKKVLGFY